MNGTGTTSLWGFTPALNLLDFTSHLSPKFLIVGAADPRHIMKTLSNIYKTKVQKIEFHIIETQATVLARDLLLLELVFEDLGNSDKSDLFMDLFGNILLRGKSWEYLKSKINSLVDIIANETHPEYNFDNLKFREKDDIEQVFKFWKSDRPFDVCTFWRYRLLKLFGNRFDSRENIVDWDYNMKLLEIPTNSIISKREYTSFRMDGQAFAIRESEYSISNRTMATVDLMKDDGLKVAKWGLFSDIVLGPFVSFGTTTEYKELLEKKNDRHTTTASEVFKINLQSCFHQINTGTSYNPNVLEISDKTEEQFRIKEKFKINMLPCDPEHTFVKKKSKYASKFNVIWISGNLGHRLENAAYLLSNDGVVIVETAKFMLELNVEQKLMFYEKLVAIGTMNGLKLEAGSKDSDFLTFSKIF